MTTGTRTVTAVLSALVVVAALAGCTAPKATPTPKPSASATLSPGLTDVTDAPGTGANLVGALKDTTVTACAQKGSTWTVSGTVTNPTGGPADYRIYVSLLNATSDTRALKQVDVDALESGAKTDWTTDIPIPDKALTCVLRVERYGAVVSTPNATPTKK